MFPGNYHTKRFGNEDVPFHILKSKYLNDYDITFEYLNEEYSSSKFDCKLYNPNLLHNDEYINDHQKNYRDLICKT